MLPRSGEAPIPLGGKLQRDFRGHTVSQVGSEVAGHRQQGPGMASWSLLVPPPDNCPGLAQNPLGHALNWDCGSIFDLGTCCLSLPCALPASCRWLLPFKATPHQGLLPFPKPVLRCPLNANYRPGPGLWLCTCSVSPLGREPLEAAGLLARSVSPAQGSCQ